MQPDLPDSYYLDNVTTLFDHIERVYADILDPAYLGFLHQFAALTDDAKRLYIRLLNRSLECFRLSKLNYPEIASIKTAATELQCNGLLCIDANVGSEVIFSLFTKTELLAALENSQPLKKRRRDELVNHLLAQNDDVFLQQLRQHDSFLSVRHKDIYGLFQMLFFGNLNQSMTDFVLRDLGLYRFESYLIEKESKEESKEESKRKNRKEESKRRIEGQALLNSLKESKDRQNRRKAESKDRHS